MANDMGSVGEAFVEISARANKASIAKAAAEAKAQVKQEAGSITVEQLNTLLQSGKANISGGSIHIPGGIPSLRGAADQSLDEWRRSRISKPHDQADVLQRMVGLAQTGAGQEYMRDKVAKDEMARDAKKQLSFLRADAAGDKFTAGLGRLNYAVEKSALPGLARFLPSTVGGIGLGIAGGAGAALAAGMYKLNADWAGYRKDVGLSNPVTAFWASQGERDASAVRGRMAEPGVREQTRLERENTNARDFWRQERGAGRSVPLMARMEQDWATLSGDWAKAKAQIQGWYLDKNNPGAIKTNTLGAGSFEQLGQHLGGYFGLYESAQTAASQSPIGGTGGGEVADNVAATKDNTDALRGLVSLLNAAGNVGLMFQGPVGVQQAIGPR